ncbi:MAG: hypothetical protein ACR2QM_18110 [Longimicrobiales bacterium]
MNQTPQSSVSVTEEDPGGVQVATPPRRRIAFRDLVIFQVKLFLDAFGDAVLSPLAVVAFAIDLLPGRSAKGTFYRVLRFGERWDRWLSLYRPSHEVGQTGEGLLEASQIDADTFLGKVEEVVKAKRDQRG